MRTGLLRYLFAVTLNSRPSVTCGPIRHAGGTTVSACCMFSKSKKNRFRPSWNPEDESPDTNAQVAQWTDGRRRCQTAQRHGKITRCVREVEDLPPLEVDADLIQATRVLWRPAVLCWSAASAYRRLPRKTERKAGRRPMPRPMH